VNAARISGRAGRRALHQRVFDVVMEPDHRAATIRSGEWRMTLHEADPPELFHLGDAIGERKNLAGQARYAGVRRDLEKKLAARWSW
jgi:hypothetical protein